MGGPLESSVSVIGELGLRLSPRPLCRFGVSKQNPEAVVSKLTIAVPNRHKRPIGSHFHSAGTKFSYLGEDLEEALGEPGEAIARKTVWETTAEHLHDM